MGKYNKKPSMRRGVLTNPNLSLVSVNVSDDLLDGLTYGKSQGWWATRSEGARIVMDRGLTVVFKEKLDKKDEIESKIKTKLDPKKEYVQIPGKGYIEIIGEA